MKIFFIYPVLFFCLFSSGCAGKDEIPKGILSINKMKPLVIDMLLLADYHKDRSLTDSSFDVQVANRAGFERILQIHKVSKETFLNSYAFYQSRPALLKVLTDTLGNATQRLAEAVMVSPMAPQTK